jgi:hypothetical protein
MRRFTPVGVLLALATVIAITLAVIALPNRPLGVGLGAVAVALIAGEIIAIFRENGRRALRDLNLDAHGLANELRALLQGVPPYSAGRNEIILENYRRRYAVRARDLALRLRTRNLIPTHYLYRLVSVGPQDEIEVWQVAEGLDYLANLLVDEATEMS